MFFIEEPLLKHLTLFVVKKHAPQKSINLGFQLQSPLKVPLIFLTLLSPATIVAKALAFLTEILRMFLSLIRHVEPVRLVQRSLLVRVHVDVTLYALLPSVRPAISTHPLALAQWAFEFSKTSFLPLVWSETLAFRSGLKLKQGVNKIK